MHKEINIKKYRADTMREALEQVKHELGEEALVLDSKRVRAGGFLGLGAREQIEVRVAADNPNQTAKRGGEERQIRSETEPSRVDLTDDAPATPARAAPRSGASPTFAALAARAYAGDAERNSSPTERRHETADAPERGIELAETAPRVVHRQSPAQTLTAAAAAVSSSPSAANFFTKAAHAAPLHTDATSVSQTSLNSELEQLRAELREVKFSLGAFATRSAAPSAGLLDAQTATDADLALYDSPFYEAYMELASTGLGTELARRAVRAAAAIGISDNTHPAEAAHTGLTGALPLMVHFAADPLTALPGTEGAPAAIAFIGPTGVGKTTTIAKLAARVALGARRRVELITLDTFRIAAIEQLKTYAEIIGAGCHVARSVIELEALTHRYAGEATILIDTIGRSPHDLAIELELADYLRESPDLLKCLVLQATTHPTDALAAARKFALYGANRLAITKLDETTRPGAAVNTAADASLPLLYLCAGQRVPADLDLATPETFAARILRTHGAAAATTAAGA